MHKGDRPAASQSESIQADDRRALFDVELAGESFVGGSRPHRQHFCSGIEASFAQVVVHARHAEPAAQDWGRRESTDPLSAIDHPLRAEMG